MESFAVNLNYTVLMQATNTPRNGTAFQGLCQPCSRIDLSVKAKSHERIHLVRCEKHHTSVSYCRHKGQDKGVCTHAQTLTHTNAHEHARAQACMCTHTCMHTTRTRAHAHTPTTHTYMCTYSHAHTHAHTHMKHTYTHASKNTNRETKATERQPDKQTDRQGQTDTPTARNSPH